VAKALGYEKKASDSEANSYETIDIGDIVRYLEL
jgi:hypothetical protein